MPFSRNIEDYPQGIILPVDKPYRWTSADVVRKIKYAACRHFGKRNLKVGHAGTLDPLATGLLLVCIGAATRRAEELQRSRKRYLASVSFGATTPSYDLEKPIDEFYHTDRVSEQSLMQVLPAFVGKQEQIAPLFSAKSVDGVRAYETARKLYRRGQAIEDGVLQASEIEIYSLTLLSFEPAPPPPQETDDGSGRIRVTDVSTLSLPTALLDVECSKGTYIRALARDLGEALGSGAFLSGLRRSENGGYTLSDAFSLQEALDQLSE